MNRQAWNKMTEKERLEWFAEKGIYVAEEIFHAPYQVVEEVTKYEFHFVTGKFPREHTSDKAPPREVEEKTEIIPIDECLGLYEPRKTTITIFNKGIKNASKIIGCNPEHLKYIVRLHEWSHALIHVGLPQDDKLKVFEENGYWEVCLKRSTKIYKSIEAKLHEHLAQLLTYLSLKLLYDKAKYDESKTVINHRIEVFRELNKRQPREYMVDDYLEVPHNRILESVSLLKKGWLKGVFEAWATVMKW